MYHSSNLQNVFGRTRLLGVVAVLLLTVSSSGCAKMMSIDRGTDDEPLAQGPAYKVIFQGTSTSKPRVFVGHINEPMTMEDALVAAGATKKYRNMLIDLARVVPENGEVLRMPVTYEPGKKRVLPQQNYAVHPGDEILVRKKSSSPFDSMLGMLGGEEQQRR